MKFDSKSNTIVVPEHIAIIPDGNRRWAKARALPAIAGHNAGAQQFKKIVRLCNQIGIKAVSFYAFSTENWKREEKEVEQLMKLLSTFLQNFEAELGEDRDTVKICVIGDRRRLSDELKAEIKRVETATQDNAGIVVNIAINYGGRDEIVMAARNLATKVSNGQILIGEINENSISQALYTSNVGDPDLLIRTSGEQRISNFLLWQLAYSEFYFCDCYWPDFDENELEKAIEWFSLRKRRFGK